MALKIRLLRCLMIMALGALKISHIFYSIIGLKYVFLVLLVPASVRPPRFCNLLVYTASSEIRVKPLDVVVPFTTFFL